MKHLLLTTIAAVVLVGCGGPSIREAAWEGDIETVKQHLAAGTDVNAKSGDGRTPLHYAAWRGHKEIIELLITNGADVNVMSPIGTPLDQAKNKSETAAFLRKHGGKSGAECSIHYAARTGKHEAVKQHLATGTDVNAKRGDGFTPLHLAATWGYKEIIELLIAAGADVNAKTKYGSTPLDWAIRFDETETGDLLRKHGGKTGAELEAEGK